MAKRAMIINGTPEEVEQCTLLFTIQGWTTLCATTGNGAAQTRVVFHRPDLVVIFADAFPDASIRTAYALRHLNGTIHIPVLCVGSNPMTADTIARLIPDLPLIPAHTIAIEFTRLLRAEDHT